jgi:hypothetical protein
MVVLQQDTNYLGAGIPVWGSRVTTWQNMVVLIYHTENMGYIVSDITDLPASTIAELTKVSDVQGMWYYLPQSLQQIITERMEDIIDAGTAIGEGAATIAQKAATAIGQTVSNVLAPVVDTLMVPLIIAGIVAFMYFLKK